MFRLLISVAFLVGGVISAAVPSPAWRDHLKVHTSSGKVTGFVEQTYPDVRQFLGIPYAQPPTGDLRWEPPAALDKSSRKQKIQATQLPPSCPQYLSKRGNSLYTLDVLEFNLQGLNTTGAVSEDCLKVSVWTPTKKQRSDLLPVLVFIYGGAFVNGGIDVPYQIPTQWVQRTQEHIVVSFNYRTNIFGFPNAKGLKEQNLGILDQRLAVKWIHENIKAFGGDPEKITLWGQSAGAQSVDFYSYIWYQDPLVKGLIMDSGTALLPLRSTDYIQSNFSNVADHFGCKNDDAGQQLACMRRVPATDIETFLQQYADDGKSPSLSFGPIADERYVFSDYPARAAAGKISNLPAIVGTNAQDGVILVPYPVSDPNGGINEAAASQAGLVRFFCTATKTIQLRQQAGLTSFRYYYNGNFSNISPRYWEGAYHSSELPLLFGTYNNYRGDGSELEEATSIAMQDAWIAFAKDGVDGLQSTGWKSYTIGEASAREFGAGIATQSISVADMEDQCNSITS